MSQRTIDPHRSFTSWLMPRAESACASRADDPLLPLVQHWVLALMEKAGKTMDLVGNGKLRKFFKVGPVEFWEAYRELPTAYDDDLATGYEADARRSLRKMKELRAQAKSNLEGQQAHYSHPLFKNLPLLGELLGLSDTDLVVLCVLALWQGDRRFYTATARLGIRVGTTTECVDIFAGITGCCEQQLNASFRPDSALRRTGLMSLEKEAQNIEDYLKLSDGLAHLLMEEQASVKPLIRHFFTPRARSNLTALNFPHLADEVRVVTGILRESMRHGIGGTNVLLYGTPGVGKTELAALIAHALNAEIYEVAYADSDGEPIRGVKRLQSYNLCQRLLSRRNDAVVLFDEMEDMLQEGETPGKAWVNRALEENPVPAIWITNHVGAIDPAYRRRFDYSLHMKTPPRAVRRQIAHHHLQDLVRSESCEPTAGEWLTGLALHPALSAGQLERAAKVAKLVESEAISAGDVLPAQLCVNRVLERSSRLLGHAKLRQGRPMATSYDLAYLNTDSPVADVMEAMRLASDGSFCFYGPPGTGKTALARHIAHTLERPVMLKRASDLLDMYLGNTEKAIAEMFEQASEESCILVLDEADSFLQNRTGAKYSWEITQVNELLTQMEEFEGIFICTTNLLDKLDPASLRRFDWKLGFQALTAAQRWALFLQEFHLLGGDIAAAQHLQATVRQQLSGLTPGDFAPVTRQYRQLGRTPSAQQLFERLRSELLVRRAGNADRTGEAELHRAYGSPAAHHNLAITT